MLRLDMNLVFTVINLLIWYALIRKFLFGPVNQIISKREKSIATQYEEAKQLQKEAEAAKEKYCEFQSRIEEEKDRAMTEARAAAREEYDQIVMDARKKADQIVETSKKEAELQKEKILGKAEQEIRSLILDTAVKSLKSCENDKALYDQFLVKAGENSSCRT